MGLITHNINAITEISSPDTQSMIQGFQDIIQNQIMSDLTRYTNLAYLGMYTDGNEAKYVIDIGCDHIALCYYYSSGILSTGLCKKDNIDSLETLCTTGRVTSSLDNNVLKLECILRIISHDNEAKVIFGLYDNYYRENTWFAIDNDSLGRKFIANGGYDFTTVYVYYDSNTFNQEELIELSCTNVYDMQALIQKSIIVNNGVMSGISNNLMAIRNDSIESDLLLIDIEGIRYRNLSGYRWYLEDK